MGKLTGPSKPPPQTGAKANRDDSPSRNGGNGEAGNTISAEICTNTPDDGAQKSVRLSFTSSGSRPNNRRSQNRPEFTSSMKKAVNSAAETALLVLDQAGEMGLGGGDDCSTRSTSSRGSRLSVGSGNSSVHSYNSRRSSGNSVGSSSLGGLGRGVEIMPQYAAEGKVGAGVDDSPVDRDTPTIGETSLAFNKSDSSYEVVNIMPFSSPPPMAFQNLPLARGAAFNPSAHTKSPGVGSCGDDLSDGKVIEVSNHFDAAAAISAALASSHLAQAAGSNPSELKRMYYYPAVKRRSTTSADEYGNSRSDGEVASLQMPLRRANSGDAITKYLQALQHELEADDESGCRKRRSLPTPEEAQAQMLLNRTSFTSVDSSSDDGDDLIGEDKQLNSGAFAASADEAHAVPTRFNSETKRSGPSHPRRRSGSALPTPEEAAAEMLNNRTSFVSVDDLSFGSNDDDKIVVALEKLKGGKKLSSSTAVEVEPKSAETQPDAKMEEAHDSNNSQCSSSRFENESNTSSVYGTNSTPSGYQSDISPISMSTGGESGENKQGGVENKKGMLGNLASSRRVDMNIGGTNHSYEAADDDYSTQSEGTDVARTSAVPQHRVATKIADAVAKARPMHRKPLNEGGSEGAPPGESTSMPSEAEAEYVASSTPKEGHSDLQKQLSPAPTHRVSLFDSFDRNWEQAIQGRQNAINLLDLGRKCFASFAVVFGSCIDSTGCSVFSGNAAKITSGDSEEGNTAVRWWVDEHVLTKTGGIEHQEAANAKSGAGCSEQEGAGHSGIPIAVIRTLWKTCFFDPDESDRSIDVNDTDNLIDSIEHTLVKELCYLTLMTTSSGVTCLRLSLDVYAEYGTYILRRYGMEDQVPHWHSNLASSLRQTLVNGNLTDHSSMIQRRYAAQALPKHTAVGILGVDPETGNFQCTASSEETRAELHTELFQNLLCDEGFVKSRAELLGWGKTRPSIVDETLNDDEANVEITQLVKQTRDTDRNMLFATMIHLKDIEWCASLCSSSLEASNSKGEGINTCTAASLLSDCVDAMTMWKETLYSIFHSLRDDEKLTICDKSTLEGQKELVSPELVALLGSYSDDANDDGTSASGGSLLREAKSLLATEDAWTTKDNSETLFQKSECSLTDVSSPRPPRKTRRKQRAGQKEGTSNAATTAVTPLARVLSIDISDLRTAVSLGRSLLALVECLQSMLDEGTFKEKGKKDSVASLIHGLQFSCLKSAIETLSCSSVTLGYILSSSIEKLEEDDLDETVSTSGPILQKFAITRESSKALLSVASILSADAWLSLGKLVGETCGLDGHTMLFSFERALLILNSPKSTSLNKPALDLLCESYLSPLTQYKCLLQSKINHSIGVFIYEQGDFDRAASYLDKSSRFRRQMLDDIRGQDEDVSTDGRSDGLSKLFNAVSGGMENNHFNGPCSMSEAVFTNIFRYTIAHSCAQLPRETFTVEELELGLSLTLEYAALTQHAGQNYQQALSFFQESLILRTMHVGKHSSDVASLQFNLGVVYDDLEQYDQAISRYHESLRIRLDHMNRATSTKIASELEDSVLLTLKCMGHVYKIINDMDNAICCYVKAIDMVNKKFSAYRESADEWSKMGMRLGLASVPVPTVIFEEMKETTGNVSWKTHFQTMNKKELCHVFDPRLSKRRSRSTMSKLRKELTKLHSTLIDLVHLRKQNSWGNESGASRVKLPGSSLLLASLSSPLKPGDGAFEAALMRSSFWMGRIRLEQTRYEEAADYLESALRSKWVLDPASSSDSDSDFSRKSLSSRGKQQTKVMDEDDPEEGQIYYALGICNAALDDHERAVRCFLTAMRYLRRSLQKVDSLEVARVLFDCATSHYYLCNFDQAVSFYVDCLRILDSYDIPSDKDGEDETPPSDKGDVSKRNSLRRGIAIYCLVLSKAAIDFDSETSNLLNEAQTLLSGCNDKIILAYMEFLTGLFLYHAASQVPVRLRSITRITPAGLSLSDGLSWQEMCQSALTLLEQVKNECWFDPMEGVEEDAEEVKHLPLSGHICFKKGQIYELIGSTDQALNAYVDAANFYRIACGDENMYVASVLHRMGMICSQRTEYHALGYFNEALSIRKNLLGGNDHLVADTLYCSAIVLARLNRYEASMERYHEALRIQMADSQDSNEVARTLAGMGICHYNHRAYDLALTCLEGAVKIRKYRVARLSDSAELVELYGEEVCLGSDFFNLGNVHMQMGDYAQAMQCFIQSRDLRWRHLGSGTIDKILDKYHSELTVDEDELLGLAHCLHNIGVVFDMKKEYNRSLPHYEEALAIKNAVAGFAAKDCMSLVEQIDPDESRTLVLESLHEDHEFPRINKATLSASVTRQKIAAVYAKQRKYNHALFHFSHALRIQRHVLGKDNFRIGSILSSMGNTLRRISRHSDTAIICYNESLRISKLRFGMNHATVASALYDIGSLYDSHKNFGKAMQYYRRALSVYKQKYSQNLRQRLCAGMDPWLDRPHPASMDGEDGETEILSTGDEIMVAADAVVPEKKLKEQYALVTEALRNAKRQDMINRGERVGCVGDSDDAWAAFEAVLFRFVEMLSTYVVDPAQTMVRDAIDTSRQRIESAAAHAVISAADAMDYQFLLLMQE